MTTTASAVFIPLLMLRDLRQRPLMSASVSIAAELGAQGQFARLENLDLVFRLSRMKSQNIWGPNSSVGRVTHRVLCNSLHRRLSAFTLPSVTIRQTLAL